MSETKQRKTTRIEARSIVSGRNLEPHVQIVLMYDYGTGDMVAQWTPAEAYNHAIAVLGAVEVASTDAFLVLFLILTEKISIHVGEAGPVLRDFRQWRERRRPPERPNSGLS